MTSERSQRDNLHGRVAALEDDVSAIRGDLAGLIVGQKSIAEALNQLATRVNQPAPATNWIGIGTLILASCGVFGALGVSALDPVRESTRSNTADLRELSGFLGGNARTLSATEAKLTFYDQWINSIQSANTRQQQEVSALRERVASLEAK